MQLLLPLVLLTALFFPSLSHSQEEEQNYNILTAIIESTEEYNALAGKLESAATGWILSNHPEYDDFQLSLLHVNQLDTMDIQRVQYCSFAVSQKGAEPFVMMCVIKPGIPLTYGFQQNNITVKRINQSKWKEYLYAYVCAALDSTLTPSDSIAIYTAASGMQFKNAQKQWLKVQKKHPEYALSGFDSIRKIPHKKKYEYLSHVFNIDDIRSISKKGIGFKKSNYDKEVIMVVPEILEKQLRSFDASDCRVVHYKFGMGLLFPETVQLIRLPKHEFEK